MDKLFATIWIKIPGSPGMNEPIFSTIVPIIRVANNEMVLLGGIERNSKEKSSSGIPFISRIPILKWIFGNSKNNKNESKLNVFIKPTLLD